MRRIRVIPVLLLKNNGLYKTIKFTEPKYVGDPINAIKIFNEKEVDEIIVLDISATVEKKKPNFKIIQDFAGECFMPACYGGGVTSADEIRNILKSGIEKVSLNSVVHENPFLVTEAAKQFGSQSIVVSIDVKKNIFGKYQVYAKSGKVNTKQDPVIFARKMETAGAGEILINSIDRDGTQNGYDLELIRKVSSAVGIPVIACGGAGNAEHLGEAVKSGASAVAAGSMFVFHGKYRAVLINFPSQTELREKVFQN